MPDLEWNKSYWDGDYDWIGRGEEWSREWGSSEAQWFGAIYPRIHRHLPAARIVEIAPGYGRWTNFLLRYCLEAYQGIDLSDECIAYCNQVFRDTSKASFAVNDGTSLDAVADSSTDFLFSFDSLVHAEMDVHQAYIPQILDKLNDTGVAFIHHSNWAASGETRPNTHCRGTSVSGEQMEKLIRKHGGHVLVQELLNWGTDAPIDAFTLFARGKQPATSKSVTILNTQFMQEATIIRKVQANYCGQ